MANDKETFLGSTLAAPEPFRNIGFPGILVAVIVSSFFAAKITCNVTVILLYGWHAFFHEGLRVLDWTHSILSNGTRLPWWGTLMIGPTVIPVTALMIFGEDFAAGRLHALLASRSRWVTAAARFVGGLALLGFSFRLYSSPQGFPFMHPIPISAFIGGAVLTWKAVATLFRNPSA
jgi:hypothetical protein